MHALWDQILDSKYVCGIFVIIAELTLLKNNSTLISDGIRSRCLLIYDLFDMNAPITEMVYRE